VLCVRGGGRTVVGDKAPGLRFIPAFPIAATVFAPAAGRQLFKSFSPIPRFQHLIASRFN
jgi:hypothetical protein